MITIKTKRIYDEPGKNDGYRVLVDRLWPRGMKKENAHLDVWIKDLAPSSDLRKWFHHAPANWAAFKNYYLHELKGSPQTKDWLEKLSHHKMITLLYAAKDEQHNHALVLQEYLESVLNTQ